MWVWAAANWGTATGLCERIAAPGLVNACPFRVL
jgi:hypothetical protein